MVRNVRLDDREHLAKKLKVDKAQVRVRQWDDGKYFAELLSMKDGNQGPSAYALGDTEEEALAKLKRKIELNRFD